MVQGEDELERLLDDFSAGRVASIGFMRSVRELRRAHPGIIAPLPLLGTAVVAGFGRHTAGRDLMTMLLEIMGFRVVAMEPMSHTFDIIDECQEPGVTVLCLSVQTVEALEHMKDVLRELDMTPARPGLVVNVGGGAVSYRVAQEVRSDVFAPTAVESARLIRKEVEERISAGL